MKEFTTACPRDCQDCCSLKAYVNAEGELVQVKGNPEHPVTRGFLCPKGRSYPQIVYHPERLLSPLIKRNGKFTKVSFEDALALIARQLKRTIRGYGNEAIMHFHYSGSETATKNIDHYFFNALGGVTGVSGDLCFSAGIAAQQYDMGGLQQNDLADLANARGCVLWGRNVLDTNRHALPFIKKCKARGGKLVVINPLQTGLEKAADMILRPRPGTDAALSLGICRYLIDHNDYGIDFVNKYTKGLAEFKASLQECSLEWAAAITGLKAADIIGLAEFYRRQTPVTTLLGFGLQRYRGGGNTIRSIDAVAALTGNLGIKGAGVSYCSDTFWPITQQLKGPSPAAVRRSFDLTNLAREILDAQNPPVKLAFITNANPVVTAPESALMQKALRSIDTVIVIDMFMTDTAREADIVLPCTTFFEEESVKVSSWSPYVYYCQQVIAPRGESRSDEEIFTALARKLKLKEFPWQNPQDYLKWALQLFQETGIDIEELKEKGYVRHPDIPQVAWENQKFKTPSEKFEFYSGKAQGEGLKPTACYLPPASLNCSHSFQLLTPHSRYRIHSQFQNAPSISAKNPHPKAFINPEDAGAIGLAEGEEAMIYNEQGAITARFYTTPEMGRGIVSLHSGWGVDTQGCANFLIPPGKTDMGGCGTLYDVKVNIKKLPENFSS